MCLGPDDQGAELRRVTWPGPQQTPTGGMSSSSLVPVIPPRRQDREGSQGLWQAPSSSGLTWGQSWSEVCRARERVGQVRGSLCLEGRGGREGGPWVAAMD